MNSTASKEIAHQAAAADSIPGTILVAIQNAIEAAKDQERAIERERCAKIAEEPWDCGGRSCEVGDLIAAKIRNPGYVHRLTREECAMLTAEFGAGWMLSDNPRRDKISKRVEEFAKARIGA